MDAPCSRFTAAEGGTRLAGAARARNTIAAEHTAFVATRLLHEEAYRIRGDLRAGFQRSVYVTRASLVPCVAHHLALLTDLTVSCQQDLDPELLRSELAQKQVLVCTALLMRKVLEEGLLRMASVNVLIIDSCHLVCKDHNLQYIMSVYKAADASKRPRILALTYPLFTSTKKETPHDFRLHTRGDKHTKKPTDQNDAVDEGIALESATKDPVELQQSDESGIVVLVPEKDADVRSGASGMGAYENYDDFKMYEKLEWKLDELERELCCRADLAEDIDGVKRVSATITKPKELIIEFSSQPDASALPQSYVELENYMRGTVKDALDFLDEHRYDPTEIYGDELYEEFKNIPDPTLEPRQMFSQFLYVLDQLGPYGADKAAFSLLTKLEKLKMKVPYERHFLLLCLCTSVLLKIRAVAEAALASADTEARRIREFSTPKLLRFIEILTQFQPPGAADTKSQQTTDSQPATDPKALDTKTLLSSIENLDFQTLGNRIEDTVNSLEANLKVLDENNKNFEDRKEVVAGTEKVEASNEEVAKEVVDGTEKADCSKEETDVLYRDNFNANFKSFSRRMGQRARGRGRQPPRSASRLQQQHQNPDALCGIAFVKEPLMAKILFMIVVELSRGHPQLGFLCGQYSAMETPADPMMEPRLFAQQRKKQEEVLKKFRMHECNLLLATSALEEGIDLPRCNLVLRWDIPASYRSYGLCRGRARAPRSVCVLLSENVRDNTERVLQNLATYKELDQIVSRKCGCGVQDEPPQAEEDRADAFTPLVAPYTPLAASYTPVAAGRDGAERERHPGPNDGPASKQTDTDARNLNTCERRNSSETSACTEVRPDSQILATKICDEISERVVSIDPGGQVVTSDSYDIVVPSDSSDKVIAIDVREVSEVKESVVKTGEETFASVDLNTAIALINRYCGKLPSDTFTRLAPQWWMEHVTLPVRGPGAERGAYVCTMRLPLNCPVKYNIVGHPMPTRVLARRMVALQACRILHKSGELDNQLMPIGKDNFKAAELELTGASNTAEVKSDPNDLARPGTTKRRQYYFKRTARAFTDCQPIVDTSDSEIEPPSPGKPKTWGVEEENKAAGSQNVLYAIVYTLQCALPERYNTRGRRLHAPQSASQALAILIKQTKHPFQIPAFPVYTRSGEVRVSLERAEGADVRVSPLRARRVRAFMRFVFAEVLRVRRRGMRLQSEPGLANNYYIVPTIKTVRQNGTTKIDIDWAFLEVIYKHTEEKKLSELEKPIFWNQDGEDTEAKKETESDKTIGVGDTSSEVNKEARKPNEPLQSEEISLKPPEDMPKNTPITKTDSKTTTDIKDTNHDTTEAQNEEQNGAEKPKVKKLDNPLLGPGETFHFDADKYKEAVVTPWYRNQDQPQYFLVAEICWHLTPDSAFPSASHATFRSYYESKYGVSLTQRDQPLLDVDHTSARLNLLTPRYVNRKGVALPVSSERTRRAKRDRLDQKQILVPELCRVHPFAAPLWFATVALPCVLYRINALLIADEIRQAVAIDVGLGIPRINEDTCPGFQWPPLDFGWSLAEVLNADTEKNDKKKPEDDISPNQESESRNSARDDTSGSPNDILADTTPTTPTEKSINDILQEKEDAHSGFEIGTWSNEMAASIPETVEYDELLDPLPSNLTFCTSASGGTNWCDPVRKPQSSFNHGRAFSVADSDCSYMSSDFDTDDSDLNSEVSDDDTDTSGFCSSKNSNAAMGVRIEYKTAHEAEAVDLERKKKTTLAPQPDEEDELADKREQDDYMRRGEAPKEYIEKFHRAISSHKRDIHERGFLVRHDRPIEGLLPETGKPPSLDRQNGDRKQEDARLLEQMFPYGTEETGWLSADGEVTLESIERHKRKLLNLIKKSKPPEEVKKLNCFSMKDADIDSPDYVNEKIANIGFDTKERYMERVKVNTEKRDFVPYYEDVTVSSSMKEFDFDYQPNLEGHPGPSPSLILQALTMSNANDGINLERLETIGDSFLKFAITAYLYCAHPTVHEGKLSHMRSKQVSNLNLYRLGRSKRLGARMIASKFEPHDNWLPPCHKPPATLDVRPNIDHRDRPEHSSGEGCFIPYNLITQHSIPDKSIADCVEALIGAYLLSCGGRGALLYMSWLGLRVLPRHEVAHPAPNFTKPEPQSPPPPPRPRGPSDSDSSDDEEDLSQESPEEEQDGAEWLWDRRVIGSLRPYKDAHSDWWQSVFGELKAPPSPLLRYIEDPEGELEQMLSGYEALERTLQYRFRDRSLLLQALTHASHQTNRLTDCYQRLEFLGDAILDYLITRHLYEDSRRHSPGALTDLRSALVNNTIFATLAVRHGFHKYFRHTSPGLNEVLIKYVKIQEENGHSISEEHYLIQEDEMEQAEDVEVPKALGDLFESVAGAIFLDSGMSLGAVWRSYVNLMGAELEAFSAAAPKSPVRELLEAEPDTAKFGKPERLADGRRVRVCVEVFGRGAFKGIGRNYRIAKGTAARCALRHLKKHRGH